jgi:hypothetical protein
MAMNLAVIHRGMIVRVPPNGGVRFATVVQEPDLVWNRVLVRFDYGGTPRMAETVWVSGEVIYDADWP